MITNRKITCTNKDGDSIVFREDGFAPFLLVSADGIYDSVYSVNLMDNAITDGAIYQNSRAQFRNIVLTVEDVSTYRHIENESDDIYISSARITGKTLEIIDTVNPNGTAAQDYVSHRSLLDKVFKEGELGRLSFVEDVEERVIDYYVEKVTGTGANPSRTHTISLICPDPFFYDPYDTRVYLAQIIADFQFTHEFKAEGEEFGHSRGVYENIYNESANENVGLTIYISGAGDIVNPIITRMEDNSFIQIGDTSNPFTLEPGDSLIITTGAGNKHVYHNQNGTITEINYRLAVGSTFIQLKRGNNNIAFNATVGKNSAILEISYRLQYARA